MRKVLLAVFLSVAALTASAEAITIEQVKTMSSKDIEAALPDSHPAVIFAYAMKLYRANKQHQSVVWYYAGQVRYRFLLLANPDLPPEGEAAQLASISSSFGQVITDFAGRSVKNWSKDIDSALVWDASNPNGFTPKEANAAALEQARKSVTDFRDQILRSEAAIRAQRSAKGLENN